jgi:hypothetical protein
MSHLRLLPIPHQPEPPDYAGIYRRLYNKYEGSADRSEEWAMRFVYVAIKGLPTILKDKNIRSFDLMSDDNGKQFLYDRSRQTCYPVAKNRPRYLRVINSINTRKDSPCFQKIGL